MSIEISDAVLAGMAAGAGTMVVPVTVLAGMGAVMESFMSLGGSGGFLKKAATGTAVYAPIGALTGLGVVLAGAPWWAAAPASLGVLAVISVGHQVMRRRSLAPTNLTEIKVQEVHRLFSVCASWQFLI